MSLSAAACLGLALMGAPAAAAPVQNLATPQTYVQTAAGGAEVRNLPDPKGIAVRSLRGGALLALHGEHEGWLKVEPPGGLEVWVFGEYLQPTGNPGWLELTGNGVYMRPLPHSQRSSFPLEQRLHRGDRVRLIARQDPSLPLEEDWVQVATPPGIWAYVAQSATQALPADFDARTAWDVAVREATGVTASTAARADAAKPAAAKPQRPAASAGAQSLLDAAHDLFAAESGKEQPDWARVRQAYAAVLDEDTESTAAAFARRKLDEIDLRLSMEQMRNDLATDKRQREEEMARLRKELEAATLDKDPLWGRYDVRGWLEKEKRYGEGTRYILRWAGEQKAEIICESGRYDLDVFTGFELGMMGRSLQRPREAASPQMSLRTRTPEPGPVLPVLDIRRLEVISGRPGRR